MAGFDLPDNDVAFNTNQSIWMSTDIDILTAGLNGVGVVTDCAVTAQGSPDMTVAIAAGIVRIASGALVTVTSGNGTITAADGTNPRIDLVSANDTGTKTVTAGTAAANPKAPALPAGNIALAMVYVPANDTTIAANQITDKRVLLSQLSKMGWLPYAYVIGLSSTMTLTVGDNLAANGGSLAMPVIIGAPMNLDSVSVRNGNNASERKWGWDLYRQDVTGDNVLNRVAASSADETFTPTVVSTRTITAASAPVILPPGLYWIVIQCRHASNNFDARFAAASGLGKAVAQTKTTTNPNGATLDFTAATWTKNTGATPGIILNGRVFGENTAF